MESLKTWTDQFNIQPTQLEAWRLEAPEDTPILFWCLTEGKIPFDQYAQWAKENYGLAVLQDSYFENSTILDIKNRVDSELVWNPWNLPVGTWDGSTFIGCVEPPSEPLPNSVYVLADPRALRQCFDRIFSEDEGKEHTSIFEMPEGLNLNLVSPEADNAPAGLNLNLEEPPPVPEVAAQEAPEPQTNVTQMTQMTQITQMTSVSSPVFNDLSGWWLHAKKSFSNCLILSGDKDGLKAVWQNGVECDGPTVALNQPSLFRIAIRTQKPYHGFVVENEIHKDFFHALKINDLPKSITAISIPAGNQNVLLVAFGYQETNTQFELPEVEDLAQRLTEFKSAA